MKRKMVVTISILVFLVFILNSFFYIDYQQNCLIRIMPSLTPSNWNSKDLIRLIKATSPEHYSFMCQNISIINKNPTCGGVDGGCYREDNRSTIYIGNDQNNISLTAAIVVHELCHARQHKENSEMREDECYREGWDYLESILIY